jgi:hypothetical protein
MGILGGFLGGKKKKGKNDKRTRRSRSAGKATPKKKVSKPKDDSADLDDEIASAITNSGKKDSDKKTKDFTDDPSATAIIAKKPAPKSGVNIASSKFKDRPIPKSSRRKRTSIAKKRIGNLLVSAQVITEGQLNKALAKQETDGGLLGQILVDMGFCNAGNVGAALNKQRTITTVELENTKFFPDAIAMVEKDVCLKHRLIPFQKIGPMLCVAMCNVLDSSAKSDVRDLTQAKLKIFDASWAEIQVAIEEQYSEKEEKPEVIGAETVGVESSQEDLSVDDLVIELPDEELDADAELNALVKETPAADIDDTVDEPIPVTVEDKEEDIEVEEISIDESAEKEPEDEVDVVEDVDDLEIVEDLEDIEIIEDVSETSSNKDSEISDKTLRAVPVSESYYNLATDGGTLTVEKRWIADKTLNGGLPGETSR